MLNRRRAIIGAQKKSRLPSIYQEVEYLQSDGAQVIFTNVSDSTQNLDINIDFILDGYQENEESSLISEQNFQIVNRNSDKTLRLWTILDDYALIGNCDIGIAHNLKITTDNSLSTTTLKIDNETPLVVNRLITHTSGDGLFKLFAYYTTVFRYGWKGRIFNVIFKSNGSKIREMIPCYRKSDNKPGMYDIVNNEFYINQGTGSDFIVPPATDPTLPSEYQKVEYIEGDGEQYIETGFAIDNGAISAELEYEFYFNSGYTSDSAVSGIRGNMGEGKWVNNFQNTYECTPSISSQYFAVEERVHQRFVFSYAEGSYSATVYHSTETKGDYTNTATITSIGTGTNTIPLFAFKEAVGNLPKWFFRGRIYYYIISVGGIVRRHFMPCYRKSDDEPGMFDLITQTFYTNANTSATSDFIVGPDAN